jgi:chromosome segregation ATPase
MNVESLKSELQQVLDNDVVLRKEFNGLKRSLSDYRNQLIMRDEDCKRLQVTIDVLNTKLIVLERDNTAYKAELTSFKELRGTINEQLQEKQIEIDARLEEIQGLRDDLNTMAASYEAQIEEIKSSSDLELARVKEEFTSQINELKTNTHYKESGIKEEFENRVSELSINWADREQSLLLNHEEEVTSLKSNYEAELSNLRADHAVQLSSAAASSSEENETLRNSHLLTISQLEEQHAQALVNLEESYTTEISNLRAALEEQRSTLTNNFNSQLELLREESYNTEIQLTGEHQLQLEELKIVHTTLMDETILGHETKIASLINEYEEKLSNTLIHSTTQNSKLNDELTKIREESGDNGEMIRSLTEEVTSKNLEITDLTTQITNLSEQLSGESGKVEALSLDFENYKQNASLSVNEQVNELNTQIASLNLAHSDYVEELNAQIDGLNLELKNMALLLEATANSLGETESALELKVEELANANHLIEQLNFKIESFETSSTEKEGELENYKLEFEASVKDELKTQELEYQKLLAENSNLIEEIDLAQDKVEAQETEITLLKGELEEIRIQSLGKSEYFKETLANRNFEITNLEANNAALTTELSQLKNEVAVLRDQVNNGSESETQLASLQQSYDALIAEKLELSKEIDVLQTVLSGLNESVTAMNEKISQYETEIESLRNTAKVEEQEAFIDRLFKQIDNLNDQKLALLDEKEQMANQLLKMNDVIGNISQQVDSEQIDVTGLNNHRKNVILANNSGGTEEKGHMKEQINDLVREIDKCIALLSA